MKPMLVLSWVGVGFFVSWIATHVRKDKSFNAGVENAIVGVLGALVGGLLTHGLFAGKTGYEAFTLCAMGSFLVSAIVIKLTRRVNRGRASSHVW